MSLNLSRQFCLLELHEHNSDLLASIAAETFQSVFGGTHRFAVGRNRQSLADILNFVQFQEEGSELRLFSHSHRLKIFYLFLNYYH